MKKVTCEEYIKKEMPGLRDGVRLMRPEEVMRRLGVNRRQLQGLYNGTGSNACLPVIRINRKVLRFHPADVMRTELILKNVA